MPALVTVNDGDLACVSQIDDVPIRESFVRVFINGMEANRDLPSPDCFFSADGFNQRPLGDERIGDRLWWNGSVAGYNLDTLDLIDFVYLIDSGA